MPRDRGAGWQVRSVAGGLAAQAARQYCSHLGASEVNVPGPWISGPAFLRARAAGASTGRPSAACSPSAGRQSAAAVRVDGGGAGCAASAAGCLPAPDCLRWSTGWSLAPRGRPAGPGAAQQIAAVHRGDVLRMQGLQCLRVRPVVEVPAGKRSRRSRLSGDLIGFCNSTPVEMYPKS